MSWDDDNDDDVVCKWTPCNIYVLLFSMNDKYNLLFIQTIAIFHESYLQILLFGNRKRHGSHFENCCSIQLGVTLNCVTARVIKLN